MLFVKQAFVQFKNIAGVPSQSLKIGRMEIIDGTEVTPNNATLAARPTRGVFQVDGWGELNVNVYYGALTGQTEGAAHAAEWRVYGLDYRDGRTVVVKTDNRQLAARRADAGGVNVATVGGHYIDAINTHHGAFDVLLWGATQFGSWGALSHRASAFAAEAGWPSNGQTGLATMYDGSAEYTINPHAAIGGYVGRASGGLVTQSIYLNGHDASFGYLEMTLRF